MFTVDFYDWQKNRLNTGYLYAGSIGEALTYVYYAMLGRSFNGNPLTLECVSFEVRDDSNEVVVSGSFRSEADSYVQAS